MSDKFTVNVNVDGQSDWGFEFASDTEQITRAVRLAYDCHEDFRRDGIRRKVTIFIGDWGEV